MSTVLGRDRSVFFRDSYLTGIKHYVPLEQGMSRLFFSHTFQRQTTSIRLDGLEATVQKCFLVG